MLLRPASVAQGSPGSAPGLTPGPAVCCQGRHEGRVNRNLNTSPEWQAVGDDLDAAVILSRGSDIEVPHQDVGGNTSTSFTANTCCRTFEWSTSRAQNTGARARGEVIP